jgi:quinol monooxygenase YgiN
MNTTRIMIGAALIAACGWSLSSQGAVMANDKVIMLIEAKIKPERRAELIEAARRYLPLVRAEPGVEAFYLTARQDDPDALVFYEVYRSQAAQDFHLRQDFTRKFLETLKSAQAADRVRTNLSEVAEEEPAPGKRP